MTTPTPEQAAQQAQQVPFIDVGNPILGMGPARLDVGIVTQPDGTKTAILTVRTQSTTTTVMLGAQDLAVWANLLDGLRDQMGGSKLQVVNAMQAAGLRLNGR